MSTPPTVASFLMGGGARAAKFTDIGDTITGTIVDEPQIKQQTDIANGQPLFWPSGDPKYQIVLVLQTDERDADDAEDDGKRTLYIKGRMQGAIRDAVGAAGSSGLEPGAQLTVKYTGDGQATQRGFNPPKLYSASYVRPDKVAESGKFLGVQPQQQAASQVDGPTAEAIAALKAAGIDPKQVYPNLAS